MSATTEPTPTATSPPAPVPGAVPVAEEAKAPLDLAPAAPEPSAVPAAPGSPVWPALAEDHPLSKLYAKLPELLTASDHNEIYGVPLKHSKSPDFHTLLILQKFLRANANDLDKAEEQLLNTLKWRKEFDPLSVMKEVHDKSKFESLGYVTSINVDGKAEVITWNIYGAVKDYGKTFVPVEEFLRWRVALMELGLKKLNLNAAKAPIPDYGEGPDPYQGIQIHDYLNVSFLRMDPRAKAVSKPTIELMGAYYPETLSRKYFVNVPLIMQWMFAAMKLFVSAETTKKFSILSYGSAVKGELGDGVPELYGGNGPTLEDSGETLKLAEKPAAA